MNNIGIKHGFSCINIRHVPREVLKTEAGGRGFQHLPRDLANVNALKNHVRSLLLHKKWKHLLHFALFLALFCFAFPRCLANAISMDYARSRVGQYTSRDDSNSVAPVQAYWKFRSRALTLREPVFFCFFFLPVNKRLLITYDTTFCAVIRIIAEKAVSHVINRRALTDEKPCTNKAIHALLMHGYATFNMTVSGPQNCCRHVVCTSWP